MGLSDLLGRLVTLHNHGKTGNSNPSAHGKILAHVNFQISAQP